MTELDRIIAARGYQNRSEAIRDLARAGIREAAQETGTKGECVAALVYVYDHAARELSKRLVQNLHGHHEMSLATRHLPQPLGPTMLQNSPSRMVRARFASAIVSPVRVR